MSNNDQINPQLPDAQPDEMFPALTTDQQSRVAADGRLRQVEKGETVVEANAESRNSSSLFRWALDTVEFCAILQTRLLAQPTPPV